MNAVDYLHRLPRFAEQGAAAFQPGLERMDALLTAMGRPHEHFASVHVAGTNGKGSTASMLAAIGTATGRRIGLHTSPHLVHLTERMRIDGVPAPTAWLEEAVARYRDVFDAVRPSFFEATVALSFRYLADAGVDLAVVEVGLGGRLDATNVLRPVLCLITSIGLDHTDLLGDTLAAIATEKAGIIKPGIPVFTSATQPEVLDVLRRVAATQAAPFHALSDEVRTTPGTARPDHQYLSLRTPQGDYPDLCLGLGGRHQHHNAALAVRAAEQVFAPLSPEAVRTGLRDVRRLAGLRGRLEVLSTTPLIVADVAHNADGLAQALAFVRQHRGTGRLYVVLGWMRDKDLDPAAALLAEAEATVFPVDLDSPRALPAASLGAHLRAQGLATAGGGRVPDGLAWFQRHATPADVLLVTGSHQVVEALLRSEAAPGKAVRPESS